MKHFNFDRLETHKCGNQLWKILVEENGREIYMFCDKCKEVISMSVTIYNSIKLGRKPEEIHILPRSPEEYYKEEDA